MHLADLVKTLYGKTALQKERHLKDLFGRDIEIRSMIGDVESDSVRLDFIVGGTSKDKGDWVIEVFFDKARFGEELLAYSYGDDVVVIGKLRSAKVGVLPTLTFDLQSIGKTGTTLRSRDAERQKPAGSKCFIATACAGDAMAPDVVALRSFRDNVLIRRAVGRAFVRVYNRYSPPIAIAIGRYPLLRRVVRACCITPLARVLR